MHGREGEDWKRWWHMWPVPALGSAASTSAASSPPVAHPENPSSESDSLRSSCDSFLKDGRKIQVGDCALFQAGNAPPFIGIIRWFTTGNEDYLKLCVNWLYRPADVKLAKGVLDAAPNEVFYSFHKDVIPAASLLHPCKVAFLRKGVELPAGISSFVCRRVYDITNKCLWWLTDQDYINERQEEVDQLLDRTRLEMHAAVQSGGRSPKPLNGPSSTQQLKSGSVTVHNTGSSLPSQSKGKKRDRSDQGTETIKRELSSKPDDVDNISHKSENMIKAEIVKITDKGGLISTEGVEKLVNLMQIDKTEKKIDVSGRILVADVIAATDRYDCLGMFVQLKGLLILDEWLQEVHKSKTNDGNSPKEGDKLAEELLLALLRALAKLPVNLNALQTCNIGKSVNNLRSHKNLEIQKKARSLIDTWKKRVDAEMTKNNDTKSVTSSHPVWQVKIGSSDISHSGNRRTGPTEVAVKSPSTQTASCKTPSGKPGHFSDAIVKTASITPLSLKVGSAPVTSVAVGLKDPLCKAAANIGSTDTSPAAAKEEKSSSSSQSQNNSQTCSGDHAKTVGNSWKEDTRSSSVGSVNADKVAGSTSRHRRSTNNVLGTTTSGFEKETHLGKSGSLNRSTTMEKSLQSEMCEKPSDVFVADHGSNHRLIVKLPNPIRSPARSANGVSVEDPSVSGSRASSPGISDNKHEHGNRRVKAKSEAHRSNISTEGIIESLQSNDIKESSAGAGGIRSAAADERIRSAEETGKATQAVGAPCSSSGNEKEVVLFEPRTRSSFSSMNALIEASTPMAVEDDNGMNLLASVAAGEISKSDLISPTGSPGAEDPFTEAKLRLSSDDDAAKGQKTCDGDTTQGQKTSDGDATQSHIESDGVIGADFNNQEENVGSIISKGVPYHDGTNCPEDNATTVTLQDNKLSGEQIEPSPILVSSHKSEDNCPKSEWKYEEKRDGLSSGVEPLEVEMRDSDAVSPVKDKQVADGQMLDHITDCMVKEKSSAVEIKLVEVSHQKIDENTCSTEVAHKDASGLNVAASGSEESEKIVTGESQFCIAEKEAPDVHHAKNHDEFRICKPDNTGGSNLDLKGNLEHSCPKLSNLDVIVRQPTTSSTAIVVRDLKVDTRECSPARLANQVPRVSCTPQENEYQIKPAGSRLSGAIEGVREDLASSAEASSVAVTSELDTASKLDFDLNEGITGDDGNQGEPDVSVATVCSTTIHLPALSPLANPITNDSPAPVTVAAPAKGPFVPPENLLWSKGEAGWKGSAATSAFRPAEPRKALEIPLSIPGTPLSEPYGKRDRPPLDIDLNEPDDRVLEDMTSHSSSKSTGPVLARASNLEVLPRISGGLDLDLNRVDQDTENGQLASTSHRLEVPILAVGPGLTEFPNREASMLRDFDLNNGPGLDEISSETVNRIQSMKNTSIPFLFPVAGVRMNASELGSVSSWFPPGSSYPAVAMPSFFSNREQPYPIVPASGTQRILGPVTASGPFGGDLYRGPVLSSSPPVAFTPTAFPYAGFTYGSNFPLPAASLSGGSTTFVDSSSGAPSGFPVIPTPLVGPPGNALPNYRRPHVVGPPEGSDSGGVDNTRKWMASSLDLNTGPGNADAEGKDDKSTLASRQLSIATSQAITEDQLRMYSVPPGGGLKRKEREGSWDADRSAYKQLSWQ